MRSFLHFLAKAKAEQYAKKADPNGDYFFETRQFLNNTFVAAANLSDRLCYLKQREALPESFAIEAQMVESTVRRWAEYARNAFEDYISSYKKDD